MRQNKFSESFSVQSNVHLAATKFKQLRKKSEKNIKALLVDNGNTGKDGTAVSASVPAIAAVTAAEDVERRQKLEQDLKIAREKAIEMAQENFQYPSSLDNIAEVREAFEKQQKLVHSQLRTITSTQIDEAKSALDLLLHSDEITAGAHISYVLYSTNLQIAKHTNNNNRHAAINWSLWQGTGSVHYLAQCNHGKKFIGTIIAI